MNKIFTNNKLVIAMFAINILALLGFIFLNVNHPKHEEPKNIIIKELHLDDKQISQYEVYIQEHQSEIRNEQNQLVNLKNKLYLNLNKPENIQENQQIINEIGEHYKKIENINYQHFIKIKNLCNTAEQKEQFRALSYKLAELFLPPPKHGRPE